MQFLSAWSKVEISTFIALDVCLFSHLPLLAASHFRILGTCLRMIAGGIALLVATVFSSINVSSYMWLFSLVTAACLTDQQNFLHVLKLLLD